ncbi:L-2-hydroxyglutarate dehydrogenase, mitochondrial [Schistocerca americana]|uniref:L-2-hydroxyglutarate dehydrogenase, mitochondrial n=1 Tax=Schistocerca americana TaxID=7009 RepID=UPI001F4F69AA|nr:L-2-hydroxyglutarate dehydrogenase, mitochondrial [Schistocerca americana]
MVSICCGRNLQFASRSRCLFALSGDRLPNLYRRHSVKIASCPDDKIYDIVIIGGGVVGMATARELKLRYPVFKMAVLEKEDKLAAHQSGNNSGVVHAGIYYKPGSLKAKLCVQGCHLSYKYFDKKNIPYKKCGKIIVATDPVEIPALEELYQRGLKNNVRDIRMISGHEIQEIEPHCHGVKAIHSPHTGIVDWGLVTEHYGKDFEDAGGKIYLNFKVTGFKEQRKPVTKGSTTYPVNITSENNAVSAAYVIVCSGLHSDVLAKMSGCSGDPRIIPFRGEYLLLKKNKCHLVNGNIYPVPDPRYPFLGVHFTPRMDGSVWLGPNAILAFKREGYRWKDFDWKELKEVLAYPGFRKLAFKYLGFGSKEMLKSAFPFLQVKELQKYIPEITFSDVERGPAGVRAQAMDTSGQLVDDFVFDTGAIGEFGERILHCRNAPSPGATSSLAIAMMIADKAKAVFDL